MKHHDKFESTALDMSIKVEILFSMQNIQDLWPKRRIFRIKNGKRANTE